MGLTVTQLATPSVVRIHLCPQRFDRSKRGNSSADRALAFQAGGRGFESRFPLSETTSTKVGVVFLYKPLKVYFHKGNTKKNNPSCEATGCFCESDAAQRRDGRIK